MIDCSPAEIAAIKEVFPTTNILLCHWHIKRTWETHIKKDVSKKKFFSITSTSTSTPKQNE
jgi:hypothetical protein